ncbi:MAG: LemA family protein [Methanobacterium formicicum]|jgi:LemA protein|uniref:LemA family protein n=1 Tax=Methanobacterium formicicum TaxID=2162 RepID=A0A090JW64_METFO|nr:MULTISPECIES: LemA family protein [Methanobacterium]AIS30936.1 LemA family protein [Methanobacterium formicicum]MBF4474890.1 LemA family protein [Methanobacterium formicicum]MDD4811087.1 LemA family protein [Methanobacterium formicicum]MDG3546963.1 LemA family protein [Methanobacterium formicicum]MDH2660637.1 LemA family protein [Methanobacterium formicicum]
MVNEMIIELIILVIIILIVVVFVYLYNSLVKLRNRVKNAWSQIDVQLNRRADLIPNLVETVKGYAKHEKTVFENVTAARAGLMNAKTVQETAEANNVLTETLKSLFAVAENYPDLKASENFRELQGQLEETENKIAYSRQFYNDTVLMYNNKCQMVPSNIIASLFNFQEEEFFEIEETKREVPKVEF